MKQAYVCLKIALGQYRARYRKVRSTCAPLLPKEAGIQSTPRSHRSGRKSHELHRKKVTRNTDLEMALDIEKKVFWLDITMSDTLTMEVGHSIQDLLKTTFDFAWTHPPIQYKVSRSCELNDTRGANRKKKENCFVQQ